MQKRLTLWPLPSQEMLSSGWFGLLGWQGDTCSCPWCSLCAACATSSQVNPCCWVGCPAIPQGLKGKWAELEKVELPGWSPEGFRSMAACGSASLAWVRIRAPLTPHQPAQEGAETGRTSISFPQPEFPSQFAVYSSLCGFIPLEFLGTELAADCPCAQGLSFTSAGTECTAGSPASSFSVNSVITWEGTEVKCLKLLMFVKAMNVFNTKFQYFW